MGERGILFREDQSSSYTDESQTLDGVLQSLNKSIGDRSSAELALGLTSVDFLNYVQYGDGKWEPRLGTRYRTTTNFDKGAKYTVSSNFSPDTRWLTHEGTVLARSNRVLRKHAPGILLVTRHEVRGRYPEAADNDGT